MQPLSSSTTISLSNLLPKLAYWRKVRMKGIGVGSSIKQRRVYVIVILVS